MSTLIPSQFPNYPNNLSALNTYLHPFWESLETATIRSLIYRAIGGCGGFENLQKYPNYTVDILRRGELLPTIMPTSPFLAKKVLHKKGFCLTCHSALRFPDGD